MVALFAVALGAAPQPDRLIAGYSYVPPLHYSTSDGRPGGFVIDVINEAARIENIQIVWRQTGTSTEVEQALTTGGLDIFPAGVVTPERRQKFWVSDPWWSDDLSVLARGRDSGIRTSSDLTRRRVLLISPSYTELARELWPGTAFVLPDQFRKRGFAYDIAATLLCRGELDGALMAHAEIDEVLLNKPGACEAGKLQIIETPKSINLAIVARRPVSGAAARLRARIDEISIDGGLTRIASYYPRLPGRSAVALAEALRMRYNKQVLWFWLAAALVLAAVTSLLLVREIYARRALKHALAELQEQSTRLATSNEELQAFAYSISHDMQEPLRMISIYAQLLERRSPPASADGQLYLETVRTGAKRLQDMLEKLLLLSRVGHSDVVPVVVPIETAVRTALDDLRSLVVTTSAQIRVADNLPTVIGWPDRLSVLFQNLIGNALKYRREGVIPEVDITAERRGDEWEFVVQDNGIGFQQEHADRIFGVFKRLHGPGKYAGSGVGLAIAKKVVERHGGRIWAESRPNQGSRFHFTLPANASAIAGGKKTARSEGPVPAAG